VLVATQIHPVGLGTRMSSARLVRSDAGERGFRTTSARHRRLTNLTNYDNFLDQTLVNAMAKHINIYEAKTRLSELVDRAESGEEIVIAKAGHPVARLVPLRAVREGRTPGRWRGRVRIADDFDAPLPPDVLGQLDVDD
jgi:prevent-host-death family protein